MASDTKLYIAGFLVVAVIVVGILAFIPGDFGGSDDSGGEAAEDHGYEPWLTDWIDAIYGELPGEIESMLFAVQAAIGAVIIGFFIGQNRAKKAAAAE
ncbi:MAG: energy-coupling factor ABC transporter substrate-binding protein [Candidatus Methanomethylophilaceae archaeon]|nr:energy-coupling factor ABC transporter substrate-binding protein [Candidatus Methanomethylophilaceae archaeon]MBP5685507.1 energy-coupling factor ABC transporter substrate-binding protein [Candidatus Methanomethylophilaceae archaeon]MBP5735010.1 energy-coupling factor ABC transporter substrate-binding protein [Candidatus Methanomethylophilaceae archaeon]